MECLFKKCEIPLAVQAVWKMHDLNITVIDHRFCSDCFMDRINPGEGAESFEKFWTEFMFAVLHGVVVRRGHIAHLHDLDFRK